MKTHYPILRHPFITLILGITILGLFVIPALFPPMAFCADKSPTNDQADTIRAKIGIQVQSQSRVFRSKARERLKAGDLIRLYVHPEKSCFIYILHSDGNTVNLLNVTQQNVQSATLILPSAQAYFEFDGKSETEQLAVICSPKKIPELAELTEKRLSHEKWHAIKKKLTEKSKLLIADEDQHRFAIAGNVRGLDGMIKSENSGISSANTDLFLKELQIFSGKGLLIKTYEFIIQK